MDTIHILALIVLLGGLGIYLYIYISAYIEKRAAVKFERWRREYYELIDTEEEDT